MGLYFGKHGKPPYPRQQCRSGFRCRSGSLGEVVQEGMTLRDYFAARAMQAVATNPTGAESFTFDERAKWAYQQADAMLKARAA